MTCERHEKLFSGAKVRGEATYILLWILRISGQPVLSGDGTNTMIGVPDRAFDEILRARSHGTGDSF